MKRIAFSLFTILFLANAALAAPIGRASADFDNARPQKNETAWGRLVADALRRSAKTDIAFINAGALQPGVLQAGDVSQTQINNLLAFPTDELAVITISGAQLRAALERAVHAYPTNSTAFLHGAGFQATFNTQADINERLTMLRIAGREVKNSDSISVAMPAPLARGGSGYMTIWPDAKAAQSKETVAGAVADLIRASGTVVPDDKARFAPQ